MGVILSVDTSSILPVEGLCAVNRNGPHRIKRTAQNGKIPGGFPGLAKSDPQSCGHECVLRGVVHCQVWMKIRALHGSD